MSRKKKHYARLSVILTILFAIPLTVLAFIKYSPYVSYGVGSVFGTKANIVVNLTDSYAFPVVPWSNFAQGGEEKSEMLTPVLGQVASLSPQYIRIDHVFDYYNVIGRDSSNNLTFDWSRLDVELRNITKTGAKPFISLSYMPAAISSGSEVDIPRNWGEWQQSVQALIEHVSGRNGLNFNEVYYEVWNEPDLFGKFALSGEKNYLTLYKYAALGAANAKNTLSYKFGGPATTALYPNWVTTFLDYTSSNNLRLDFYSWHRYSSNITVFEDDIAKAKELIYAFPRYKDLELIMSETGYDSEINKVNDGILSAVHTIALYASTFQKINRVFMFEIIDGPGPQQYWGRWGMLTHESFGIPVAKPKYLSLQFLNRMRGEFYPVYGQGTWVKAFASTSNKTIRLLLVNYDPAGRHVERVPVSFVNLPSQSFTYRRIDFMGKSTEREVSTTGKNWNTQEYMLPNSAAILEIIP